MNKIKYSTIAEIEDWKTRLLYNVVDGFAKPGQGDFQNSVAVWKWTDQLPFPTKDNININGGCLTFDGKIGTHEIFFSVWYQIGEIRIGARLPTVLLGANRDKISRAFNGQPCNKMTEATGAVFFDWIFESGFASYEVSTKAMQDDSEMMAVASRIADIMTHIYMAVMNILIDVNKLEVTFKKIGLSSPDRELVMISVKGSTSEFEYWAPSHGVKIHSKSTQGNGVVMYQAEMVKGTSQNIIKSGVVIDGGRFDVLASVPLPG